MASPSQKSESRAGRTETLKETDKEIHRRQRRGVALTALDHLLTIAMKPYVGDRPSEQDLLDAARRVGSCLEDFEGEANEAESALAGIARPSRQALEKGLHLLVAEMRESEEVWRKAYPTPQGGRGVDARLNFANWIKHFRETLEAALAAPPEGWQDIASVPKDGGAFLVCDGNGDIQWAFYDEGVLRNARMWTIAAPTHWMPLPAPPLPASRSGETER